MAYCTATPASVIVGLVRACRVASVIKTIEQPQQVQLQYGSSDGANKLLRCLCVCLNLQGKQHTERLKAKWIDTGCRTPRYTAPWQVARQRQPGATPAVSVFVLTITALPSHMQTRMQQDLFILDVTYGATRYPWVEKAHWLSS